jgi:Arc/MetJ family transcription regulator
MMMRITVEIDDKDLKDLKRYTGLRKKSPAVGAAVAEYLRRQKVDRLLKMIREGRVDYKTTNEEIERMWDD